jgi:hypothetical protein
VFQNDAFKICSKGNSALSTVLEQNNKASENSPVVSLQDLLLFIKCIDLKAGNMIGQNIESPVKKIVQLIIVW